MSEKLEIKTFFGDWKKVTKKQAEAFYQKFYEASTAIALQDKCRYFNDNHIRGGHAMLSGKVETNDEQRNRIFQVYKNDLIKFARMHERLRFLCIEYVCSFTEINPYKMAASLIRDGIEVVYDDSSISQLENLKKRNKVNKFLKKDKEEIL